MTEFNLRITRGGSVTINEREYSFSRLLDDGRMVFEDAENGRIKVLSDDDFVSLYASDRLSVKDWKRLPIAHSDVADRALESLPPEATTKAEWRHAYCVAFDARPGLLKNEACLTALIDEVAAEKGHVKKPNWKTLLTWLRERGVPGRRPLKAMRSYDEKKGRTRGIDDAVEEIIQNAIRSVYLNRALLPATAVYEAAFGAVEKRNRELIETADPSDRTLEQLLLPHPVRSTVFRRIRDCDYYRTIRARHGSRAADLELKPLRVAPEATYPLERVLIDHTKLDGWMLFDETSALPCGGRPWLTMAIDAYSRYPLGFYIGFEPPSVYSVMMCLRQAIAPKAELLKQAPGLEHEWLAMGTPMKLVADNAKEVVGISLPRACAELAIELETSPVKTPKHKGIIERFFGTMNKRFMHRLPGTTYGNPKLLRDLEINPQNTMRMSFAKFQLLFLKWLLGDYCKSRHRMIGTTPERRWIEGTAKRRIDMPERIGVLKSILSRHGTAVLDRNGIRFQNLTFRSDDTIRRMFAGTKKSRIDVDFRFDPADLSEMQVLLKTTGEYLPLVCDQKDYAKGLSLWQHKIIQQQNRDRDRRSKNFRDLMLTRSELIAETVQAIKAGAAKTIDARFQRLGETGSIIVTTKPARGQPRNGAVSTNRMISVDVTVNEAMAQAAAEEAPVIDEPNKISRPKKNQANRRTKVKTVIATVVQPELPLLTEEPQVTEVDDDDDAASLMALTPMSAKQVTRSNA
ncbi:hypothetical protein GCM10008171_28720 [Methylopila jiangsuensis]|uniref:Integrase catalytic domain-containing protein n=1 Tax=Methylopila jiangsuensis TaxID=586230 RepID=A0A9W6JLC0_9HYPH|nr:Mu transposase C-terminal domain-containing protein [Methylopila jiangsuensis]MDR6284993.1 putative transposase [Methylopila jiangsuensis]GLK77618.1 hypothetical protein GCM10008171_28720 [Methylopila jiangsuensis]